MAEQDSVCQAAAVAAGRHADRFPARRLGDLSRGSGEVVQGRGGSMTSTSEATKELCLALMHADSQREAVTLLQDAGYWDDGDAWRFLGDQEGNWSSIGNQQSEAV